MSALMVATWRGYRDVAELLLDHGADFEFLRNNVSYLARLL